MNKLLRKIEGASKIQYYLLNVSFPTATESKRKMILGDVKNLSKYINNCSRQCQTLEAEECAEAEESSHMDITSMTTPVRCEKSAPMSTPGSFDRLLAKLMSPSTSHDKQKSAMPIGSTSQSVFNPTTPPRQTSHHTQKDTDPDNIVLQSLNCWTELPGPHQSESPSTHAPAQPQTSSSPLSPHIPPSTQEVPSPVTTQIPVTSTIHNDSAPPVCPERSCSLNIKHVQDGDCSRPVRVLFTMGSRQPAVLPAPPTSHTHTDHPTMTPLSDLHDNDDDTLILAGALDSPCSPPPPPPSDGSDDMWSPSSEAPEGAETEKGLSRGEGITVEVEGPDGDRDEDSSPLRGEGLLLASVDHTPPCSPAVSSPPPSMPATPEQTDNSQSGHDSVDKEDSESLPRTPVEVDAIRLQHKRERQHIVSGISPVRTGGGGLVPTVVKVQRSKEWTPEEIATVFRRQPLPVAAHLYEGSTLGVSPAGGVHSKWMSRHVIARDGPRRSPARGEGNMPPNKLHLRQVTYYLAMPC